MRRFLAITLSLLLWCSTAQAGDIGKEIERGLGGMVADELESSYGVNNDPLLTDWVNSVGQRLAAASGRTDVKYRFRVLASDDVNAVAAPGGFVYVNRGTLRFVRSEDELAAVMGHEVGHVAGKHAMKQLGAQVLGALAIAGFQAMHAETLRTVGSVAGGLAMLKFSRDEENDADRRGLREAVATGYSGPAMLDFFRRLETTEKDKPGKLEVYFLTHPPTTERLRRIAQEPGTADTAANAVALGDGYASRSLYREAAAAYAHALKLDPANPEALARRSLALSKAARVEAVPFVSGPERERSLARLAGLSAQVEQARGDSARDRKELADAQKGMDGDMDAAANSLTTVSQHLTRRDTEQFRQFARLARSFDQVSRLQGSLRAAGDMADATLDDMGRLCDAMKSAIERGDGAAAREADQLGAPDQPVLALLDAGFHDLRGPVRGAREGAGALRQAADSLLSSYRLPFGYTSGQFDILDLQVESAQSALEGSAGASRRAVAGIAHARAQVLAARINFATRSVASGDTAVAGVIARYLGQEPAAVAAQRSSTHGYGDIALQIAADRSRPVGKKDQKAAKPADPNWDDVAIMLALVAGDVEKEVAAM